MAPPRGESSFWSGPGAENVLFAGFSWHTCHGRLRAQAGRLIEELRPKKGRKSAVDWATLQELLDGFYLGWKVPAKYTAGYVWISHLLGSLGLESGQTSN